MKNYITAEEAQQFVIAARERIERTWNRGIAAYASDLIDCYAIDIAGYPDKRTHVHQHRSRGDRACVFDHCIGGPPSLGGSQRVLT